MSQVSAAATAPLSIEARGLAHLYSARRGLLPVDFAARAPGVLAVTGPNGSGKSTLLRLLAGLLRPTAGGSEVKVDGRPVPPPARREVLGLASPELAFYAELSSLENLAFAAEARGARDPRGLARAALARVGLDSRADDRVNTLSSGMKQRLRLAFAVLHQPGLLLLDEPGSHMDDEGRRLVERLATDEGRRGLVVIATNDEREWTLAERRIELRGRGLGHPA